MGWGCRRGGGEGGWEEGREEETGSWRRPKERESSSVSFEGVEGAYTSTKARRHVNRESRKRPAIVGAASPSSSARLITSTSLPSLLPFEAQSSHLLLSSCFLLPLLLQEICNTCSRIRNTCQCCILDLYVLLPSLRPRELSFRRFELKLTSFPSLLLLIRYLPGNMVSQHRSETLLWVG